MGAELIIEKIVDTYVYILAISGIVAFFLLVIAGMDLLTSAGNPEKVRSGKDKIKGVFLGLAILFSSYIIINTINPDILNIDLEQPQKLIFEPTDKREKEVIFTDLLATIRHTVVNMSLSVDGLKSASDRIRTGVSQCSCSLAQPLCFCEGQGGSSDCQAGRCYSQNNQQPCDNAEALQNDQRVIIAWSDELGYYRGRASGEKASLDLDISNLNDLDRFYTEKLANERSPGLIENYQKSQEIVKKEIELKSAISAELGSLIGSIDLAKEPALNLSALPNQCLEGLDRCVGGCLGFKACQNDTIGGCQPGICFGPNPCPTGEINSASSVIDSQRNNIKESIDKIISGIDDLIKLKTVII